MRAPLLLTLLLLAPRHGAVARRRGGKASVWDATPVSALDVPEGRPRCDLPRIAAADLTAQRFAAEFRHRAPVVIEGLAASEAWPAFTRWQKQPLLDRVGDRAVLVRDGTASDLIKQKNGAGGSRRISFRKFIAEAFDRRPPAASTPLRKIAEANYQIDQSFLAEGGRELLEDFSVPAPLASLAEQGPPDEQQAPFMFAGARGSGVGFHRHGEAWNAVVFGRKRWFFFPPAWRSPLLGVEPDLDVDGLAWLRGFYEVLAGTAVAPIECVTGPGDVMYIPASWHHATVNVQDTIGVFVNHVPFEADTIRPVGDYHWRVAPKDTLDEATAHAALDGGVDCRIEAEGCLEQTVDAAVVLLAEYIWCEEDGGGVAQPRQLSREAVERAEKGLALLRAAITQVAVPMDDTAARRAWARGAFVLGMGSVSCPGPHANETAARTALSRALAVGYAPVGFKEHQAALEGIRLAPEGISEAERAEQCRQGVALVDAAVAMPSSHHGINLYARSTLLMGKASFLRELGEGEAAVAALTDALELNPLLPAPYMMRAQALSKLGQHSAAAASLQAMVDTLLVACERCASSTPGVTCSEGTPGDACAEVRRAEMILADHKGKAARRE
jgi:hypothetical protein